MNELPNAATPSGIVSPLRLAERGASSAFFGGFTMRGADAEREAELFRVWSRVTPTPPISKRICSCARRFAARATSFIVRAPGASMWTHPDFEAVAALFTARTGKYPSRRSESFTSRPASGARWSGARALCIEDFLAHVLSIRTRSTRSSGSSPYGETYFFRDPSHFEIRPPHGAPRRAAPARRAPRRARVVRGVLDGRRAVLARDALRRREGHRLLDHPRDGRLAPGARARAARHVSPVVLARGGRARARRGTCGSRAEGLSWMSASSGTSSFAC